MQFVNAKILEPFTVSGLPEFKVGDVRAVELYTALEFEKRGLVEVLGTPMKEEVMEKNEEEFKTKNVKLK